jgi:5-methyltetrahydrofolate--homocysteine methyltransferase
MPGRSFTRRPVNHPESKYFATGKLGKDQIEDIAKRMSIPLTEAEKWLAPYLDY